MNLGEAGGVPADVQWPGFVAGSGSVARALIAVSECL